MAVNLDTKVLIMTSIIHPNEQTVQFLKNRFKPFTGFAMPSRQRAEIRRSPTARTFGVAKSLTGRSSSGIGADKSDSDPDQPSRAGRSHFSPFRGRKVGKAPFRQSAERRHVKQTCMNRPQFQSIFSWRAIYI
jgi:hypothetical protein